MADLLLFGRLADARRARPRRFRLCNAHLDEYLSENDVTSRFCFGRDSINYLADLFSDGLERNIARNHVLSPLAQVLVALRFFASGSFLEVIGDTFGLPKSTVSRCITAVSQALVRRRSTYVHCLAEWGQENHNQTGLLRKERLPRCDRLHWLYIYPHSSASYQWKRLRE